MGNDPETRWTTGGIYRRRTAPAASLAGVEWSEHTHTHQLLPATEGSLVGSQPLHEGRKTSTMWCSRGSASGRVPRVAALPQCPTYQAIRVVGALAPSMVDFTQSPGGEYFTFFWVAESISSGVRSTTVLTVAPPPAVTASARAAAASLSGRSATVNTSVPPNAK